MNRLLTLFTLLAVAARAYATDPPPYRYLQIDMSKDVFITMSGLGGTPELESFALPEPVDCRYELLLNPVTLHRTNIVPLSYQCRRSNQQVDHLGFPLFVALRPFDAGKQELLDRRRNIDRYTVDLDEQLQVAIHFFGTSQKHFLSGEIVGTVETGGLRLFPPDNEGADISVFGVTLRSRQAETARYFVKPGDTNGDRVVNFRDFRRLANNYGMEGDGVDWLDGDFNGDGLVGFRDFAALASNFGNDDNVQRVLVIPEPSSLVLCSGVLGFLMLRQRRR